MLDLELYDRETACDWTVGSFMLVRRAALDDVGAMDEQFFLYCEETDFCLRMHRGRVGRRPSPQMTILHQSSTTGSDERLSAQMAFARRQYMTKHFSTAHRTAATLALGLGYALRSVRPGRDRGGSPAPRLRSLCPLGPSSGSRRRRSAIRRRAPPRRPQRQPKGHAPS